MVWQYILQLREKYGTTIFITTHDMGEVEVLCRKIAIMSKGKIVVLDTVQSLKESVGGDVISLTTKNDNPVEALTDLGMSPIHLDDNHYELMHSEGERAIPLLMAELPARGIKVESVSLKKPTLDDVFMKYVGVRMDQEQGWRETWRLRRSVRKLRR